MAASSGSTMKYNLGDPTVPFTSETTQFHEECLRRGILTQEQTIVARGATLTQARHVLQQESTNAELQKHKTLSLKAEDEQYKRERDETANNNDNTDSDSDHDSDSDDEEFYLDDPTMDQALQQYRQARLAELQQEHLTMLCKRKRSFGEVVPIVRADWTREVNDASRGTGTGNSTDDVDSESGTDPCWVIILLTASPGMLSQAQGVECVRVERAVHELATNIRHRFVKFVSIPFQAAIEHWPAENLPTLFLYYDGTCRHQLIGLTSMGGPGVNAPRLEWTLAQLKCQEDDDNHNTIPIPPVLTTNLTQEPERSANSTSQEHAVALGQLGQSLQQASLGQGDD
jgi:hypothetical protein